MSQDSLAIEGGSPAIDDHSFVWPLTSPAIVQALESAIQDGSWGQYEARWTDQLTTELAERFEAEHVILCCSGTIAVELALRGAGVQRGDEVILAGYDFPGNFRAIEAIEATPVLVDVVANGWVIDSDNIAAACSEKTSAVIVSHLHGQTADMVAVRQVVTQLNANRAQPIKIVEDVCQSPGGQLAGQPLGAHGDVASLSFGGSKPLTAGRGGAVLTRDPNIAQRIRIFSQRGNEAFPLSQLQAAVLLPQLESLAALTKRKQTAAARIIEQTASLEVLTGLAQIVDNTTPAFYKLPFLLKDRTPGWARIDFIEALKAEGLPVGDGFRGFLRRSPRRCRKVGTLVNSQVAAQQTVLMAHPVLLAESELQDRVAAAIAKVVRNPR